MMIFIICLNQLSLISILISYCKLFEKSNKYKCLKECNYVRIINLNILVSVFLQNYFQEIIMVWQ
jgi:hypothetical protein